MKARAAMTSASAGAPDDRLVDQPTTVHSSSGSGGGGGVITAASQLDVDPRLIRLTDRGQVFDQHCASPDAHDTPADEVPLIARRSITVIHTAHTQRWLGSRVVSVLDSGAEGPGFKSQPRRCRVTVLGKLFTTIVPLFTKQRNW